MPRNERNIAPGHRFIYWYVKKISQSAIDSLTEIIYNSIRGTIVFLIVPASYCRKNGFFVLLSAVLHSIAMIIFIRR